jgi:hypothetical protein
MTTFYETINFETLLRILRISAAKDLASFDKQRKKGRPVNPDGLFFSQLHHVYTTQKFFIFSRAA